MSTIPDFPSYCFVSVSIIFRYCIHYVADTESAKAARRQLKEAIYSVLFGMDVPAICAINQVVFGHFLPVHSAGLPFSKVYI